MKPGKVNLEPNNTDVIVLLGKPVKPGSLKVKGCKIRVTGCLETVFQIGTTPEGWVETEKIKIMGLEAKERRSSVLSENDIPKTPVVDEPTWLVIPELPVLSIKNVNSPRDSIMLYEGESQTITMTLENLSSIPINLLLITFTDSASPILEAALQSKTLPASEAYEHEFFLHKRPCFRLDNPPQSIPAKTAISVPITVLGKRGMDQCSVRVEYSSDAGEHVYTRKIAKKFLVTVTPCVEVAGCDVLENKDGILLMLDIRSTSVENTLVTIRSDASSTTVPVTIGRLSRIVRPISKIRFAKGEEQRPIPSLSRRQFIVSSSGTPAHESEMRECFWFRDALLKQLEGEWICGDRLGNLELRGIRLNPRICRTLLADDLQIQLDIVGTAKIDTFVPLTVNIHNDRDEGVRLFLRIQPMIANQSPPQNLEITKRVGWNGVLQFPFPLLQTGE
ncbi:Transport protein particle subunit trs120, partial [Neolecta irregularis DAH-3]